jgi:hypothetical protein
MTPQMFIGTEPRPGRMDPVRNGDGDYTLSVKATGGLWTSSYRDGKGAWRNGDSSWLSVLTRGMTPSYVASHPGIAAWRCTPKTDSHIWCIDTADDLGKMLAVFGRYVRITRQTTPRDWMLQQDWLAQRVRMRLPRLHHLSKMSLVPDFERMAAEGWDGVWLTHTGYLATRFSRPNLYGWDCECTFWLGGTGWPFAACELDRPIARPQEVAS